MNFRCNCGTDWLDSIQRNIDESKSEIPEAAPMNSTFAIPTLSMRKLVSCASWLWWGTFEHVIVRPSGEREKNAGHPAMPTHKHAQSPTHTHTHTYTRTHTVCHPSTHTRLPPFCHCNCSSSSGSLSPWYSASWSLEGSFQSNISLKVSDWR